MLVSKTAYVKWNSKNKKHYVELGYNFTKMNDEFEVDVNHLTSGSNTLVTVQCDYCKKIYTVQWDSYLRLKKKLITLDCCNDPSCIVQKVQDTIRKKYGVDSVRELDFVNEKIKNTNLKRYGCENPFSNEEVKEKIRQYNLDNYGVEYSAQRPEVVVKRKQTCLEKYGVENYGKIYSETHSGELSSCWKGGVEYHRVERSTVEYRNWRREVFKKDGYKCQCCGIKNHKGLFKSIRLEAHHINDWKNNVSQRYDVDNGITFCERCHTQFHSDFGKKGNDNNQLQEFLHRYIDEKIC